MYPPADDNYGVDACSILCLKSVPPVVVIATCSGTLYHCVLLTCAEDDEADNKVNTFHHFILTISQLELSSFNVMYYFAL